MKMIAFVVYPLKGLFIDDKDKAHLWDLSRRLRRKIGSYEGLLITGTASEGNAWLPFREAFRNEMEADHIFDDGMYMLTDALSYLSEKAGEADVIVVVLGPGLGSCRPVAFAYQELKIGRPAHIPSLPSVLLIDCVEQKMELITVA